MPFQIVLWCVYVCVCMYVCARLSVCVCMFVFVHVCACMFVCAHLSVCVCVPPSRLLPRVPLSPRIARQQKQEVSRDALPVNDSRVTGTPSCPAGGEEGVYEGTV